MVVSRDLSDAERLEVYAHLIAHALLDLTARSWRWRRGSSTCPVEPE